MMNWAALPGNDRYFDSLRDISEENGWRLGDRLFHGDDHIVGQLNQVMVANPDVSLEFVGDYVSGVGMVCQLRWCWCWCDALFMSPQTWIKLSLVTDGQLYGVGTFLLAASQMAVDDDNRHHL